MPQRRLSETIHFKHDKFVYTATLGFYDDGRIGEIFLSSTKSGSFLDIATRDSAIALSFALQHGARISTMREAMTRDGQGRAEGALGALLDRLAPIEAEIMAQLAEGRDE
ncbi:hypothetical protein EOA24_00725 [Mesorhizobium sp. M2A.F.Ca.ET.039.01.1.1]|nr:hypothetical protein EOA24_00725 [Mesorhizobium sp. M2A.F.Ca.ET.039.01.1.1]